MSRKPPKKPRNRAEAVVFKFGGLRSMARILGHKHPTTIQGWVSRGVIPPRQHRIVWDAAQAHKVKLRKADFFATMEAA